MVRVSEDAQYTQFSEKNYQDGHKSVFDQFLGQTPFGPRILKNHKNKVQFIVHANTFSTQKLVKSGQKVKKINSSS